MALGHANQTPAQSDDLSVDSRETATWATDLGRLVGSLTMAVSGLPWCPNSQALGDRKRRRGPSKDS